MKAAKLILAFYLLTINIVLAGENQQAKIATIIQFDKFTIEEQVKYFNSLNSKDKMNFFKDFLPTRIFLVGIDELIKFFPNGEMAYYNPYNQNYTKYKNAFWEITGDILKVYKKDETIYALDEMVEYWDNFTVKIFSPIQPGKMLFFSFKIKGKKDQGTLSDFTKYVGPDEEYFRNYEKMLKEREKIKRKMIP